MQIQYFLIRRSTALLFGLLMLCSTCIFAQTPSGEPFVPDPDAPAPPPAFEGVAASTPAVGSFQVSDGAVWTTNPPTFTCQETCAELFDGQPGDYVCSTNSGAINGAAWASTWGSAFHCNVGGPYGGNGIPIADDYKVNDSYNCGSGGCSISTYVGDNCGFSGAGTSENFCFARQDGRSRATFTVSKDFVDGNSADVEVTLNCYTGLPLEQSTEISEGQSVNFVVVDFDDGELDCEVSEDVPVGYTQSYWEGTTNSDTSCEFEDVEFGDASFCIITNTPDQVDVNVDKVWVLEGTDGSELDASFNLTLICNGQIADFAQDNDGLWRWTVHGDDTGGLGMRARVTPDWDDGTDCWVEENVYDSSVEADNGCQYGSLHIEIGQGASCVITNTVFYEGIPTLGHYALAVLALLMLGVGLVGFRRYV